jgi:hypothetical protein
MAKIEKFEDIQAWQLAREVTNLVYAASASGNFSRDFGLSNQMRRLRFQFSQISKDLNAAATKNFCSF